MKKTLSVALVALSLAACSQPQNLVMAPYTPQSNLQAQASMKQLKAIMTRYYNEVFDRFDANKDNLLTADESKAPVTMRGPKGTFQLNNETDMTREEFLSSRVQNVEAMSLGVKDLSAITFAKMDKSGDKRLQLDEFMALSPLSPAKPTKTETVKEDPKSNPDQELKNLFKKLDRNHNGYVTPGEFEFIWETALSLNDWVALELLVRGTTIMKKQEPSPAPTAEPQQPCECPPKAA